MEEGRGAVEVSGVFVGREAELAELRTALETAPLIVLTGPPGVGKTRLAREVTARARDRYPDGACFVELAELTDAALIPVAVARALAVWEQPGRPVIESIVARLSARRVLLVLDNCEQVLRGSAELSRRLLDDCPGLSILATSQEALGVTGEQVWPVAPLALPERGGGHDLNAASEAVALFCSRATAVLPRFHASEANVEVVAEICRRLDGIPLAIELAAARVNMLTVGDIAQRLDRRFTLLTGGSSRSLPRHQTLRSALAWSYELLGEPDQRLLRTLSVFAGGCSREAVEAMGVGVDRLTELVAKSLVLSRPAPDGPRYRMLETVRLFAAERLAEAGEAADVRARHARWCLELAECAEPHLTGPEQLHWFALLDREHDNLRAALSWALAEGEVATALRLAGALTIFWRVRCRFREGLEHLTAALALDPLQPVALRAKALWGAGFMAVMLNDAAAARRLSEQSLASARETADRRVEARALLILGNAAWSLGEPAGALRRLHESAELAREAGDGWCLAHALGMGGFIHLAIGEMDAARPLLEECLAEGRRRGDHQSLRLALLLLGQLATIGGETARAESLLSEALRVTRDLGEPFSTSAALNSLGELATQRGDYDGARELIEAALALDRQRGASQVDTVLALAGLAQAQGDRATARDLYGEAMAAGDHARSRLGLGEVAASGGEWAEARRRLEEAAEAARKVGDRRSLALATAGLARVARADGDLTKSVRLQIQALGTLRDLGDPQSVARSLEDLGGLAAGLSAAERAARLFGAARTLRGRSGQTRQPPQQAQYEADVSTVTKQLGDQAFQLSWEEGAALPLAQALAYATRWKGVRGHAASGRAGLTTSERRVAGLVAQGMTNAEAAAEMGVSPFTVATHLTRIFAKLGIRSRRELRVVLRR